MAAVKYTVDVEIHFQSLQDLKSCMHSCEKLDYGPAPGRKRTRSTSAVYPQLGRGYHYSMYIYIYIWSRRDNEARLHV